MRFCLFIALLVSLFAGTVMATEEAKYAVIEKSGAFELRAYNPKILAETSVAGSLDEASSIGFRLIADYIFGNNTSTENSNEKISMTTPVTITPKSEKSSMTAPVSIEQSGEQWLMNFVMPSQYTLASLPKPNNPAVTLREVPASNYAVICFSGFAGEDKIARKTADLLSWLNSKGIAPIGKPELARYNPPWTLPFLRRNEIMVSY
jgi:hypothetical protein